MKSLLLSLVLCLPALALADTVTVNWTNPTTNTNGSAIPASGAGSLTSARIEYGTCGTGGTFGTKAGEVTRAMPATSTTLNLQPGTTCVRAFVTNTYGKESAASNVTSRVIDAPAPNPPQLTTIDPVAYDVRPNERTFAFDRGRPVGVVKLGTACDSSRTTGRGFYAIQDPARVRVIGSARSTALVALCGPQA